MSSSIPSSSPIASSSPSTNVPLSILPSFRPSTAPNFPTNTPTNRSSQPTISPTAAHLCAAYSVSNTNSAGNPNAEQCYIVTTPGSTFTISSCPNPATGATCANGQTFANLFDQNQKLVTTTTSTCGTCGYSMTYTVPGSSTGPISILQYTILEGCVGDTACSGRFNVDGTANVVFGARPSTKPATIVPTSTPTFFPLPYEKNAPWPHFRGANNENNGQGLSIGPNKNTTFWSYNLGSAIYGTVAVAFDGSAFVGTKSGVVFAFDITGFQLWQYTANSGIYSSIAIGYDSNLYFTTIKGTLYKLSQAGQGTPLWTYQSSVTASLFQTISSPVITNLGVVYFGSDKLYAVSVAKGSLIWSYDPSATVPVGTNSYIASSPTIDTTGNIYFGSNNNNVYSVSSWGSLNWKYSTGGAVTTTPTVRNQAVYVGSTDGYLYALGGGSVVWKYKTNGPIASSPALAPGGGTVYVGSSDNSTYSLSSLGAFNWKYTTGGPVLSSVTVDYAGIVYFGSNDKSVYSVSATGTILWKYKTKNALTSSLSIGYPGMSYIGSTDNSVYCIGKLFVTPNPATTSSSGASAVNTSFIEPLIISFVIVFFIAIASFTYYIAFGCEYCKSRKFSIHDEETMEGMENNDFPPEVDEAVVRKFEEETNMPLSALTTFDLCQLLPNIDMAEYVINFRMRKITGKMLYKIETVEQMSILGINMPAEKKRDFLTIIEFMRSRGVEKKLLVDLPFNVPSPSQRPSIEMISSGDYYGNVASKVAAMSGDRNSSNPDKTHPASNKNSRKVAVDTSPNTQSATTTATTNNTNYNRNSTGQPSITVGVSPLPSPQPFIDPEDDPMSAYPGAHTRNNQLYSSSSPNPQGVYKTATGVGYTKTGAIVKEEDMYCFVCNKKLPSVSVRECPSCRSMIVH